jgi:ATP synthase protein I
MTSFPLVRVTMIWTGILIVSSVIAWYLYPTYQPFIAGLMVGMVASLINGLILAHKMVQAGEYAMGLRKRVLGTGMLQRFLMAIFAIYIGIKFPVYFHYTGIIIGLMVVTILSLLYALWQFLKEDKSTMERGEN